MCIIGDSAYELKHTIDQVHYKALKKEVSERDEQIKLLNATTEEPNNLIRTLQEELVDIKYSRWFPL